MSFFSFQLLKNNIIAGRGEKKNKTSPFYALTGCRTDSTQIVAGGREPPPFADTRGKLNLLEETSAFDKQLFSSSKASNKHLSISVSKHGASSSKGLTSGVIFSLISIKNFPQPVYFFNGIYAVSVPTATGRNNASLFIIP